MVGKEARVNNSTSKVPATWARRRPPAKARIAVPE
jgi:hypothetical protein